MGTRSALIWKTILWTGLALVALAACETTANAQTRVERWGVFEVTLPGPTSPNPYLDVRVSATFSQGDQRVTVPGFWDGGDTYKIRFSAPATGEWRYETRSASEELNGKTGTVTVTAPTAGNHGPVEVFQTYYLRYTDGTPYHEYGTTCYAWVHQTEALQAQTLKTLAASPFNKIRFCVFPKSYAYNQNEPEFFAFKKDADGTFDFSRPDPAFWRHFEKRILDLQRLGIEADLILWHPYDRWGFKQMSDAQDDRYLRYCIARLSAFRNVWWSLANEYDFMSNLDSRHHGIKTMDDWDRFFSILQKEDPHQRLRGIHNGSVWYDHTKDWVTHASLQTSDMNGGVRFRAKYQKPIIYDECKYEGNIPQGWGNLSAREMTQRFWLGTLSGCYVGHGETYKDPHDVLWWSKGGALHGESPKRIQWLKDFMAEAPAFHELKPLGDDKGTFVLAKEGEYYLLYCPNQSARTIGLSGVHPYKVDRIDPWDMTVTPAGTASAGPFTLSPPRLDQVYRFTPYGPGEKLRPQARIEASVSEGLPPLKVTFASAADGQAHWDFGDGTMSQETNPTHVFHKTGLYRVTLTVTDAEGSSAQAFQTVAVEQEVTAPCLRVGLPARHESPAVTLEGTARRGSDGSFHLPDGEPWGWVQVGHGPLDDVRGLRSFTVMGWLKPESLEVGSGGNRILFCLKGSGSGIDLVCHRDGRLRLAVNEWPDSVNNDSSPGKLQVGKWTFFAVSYNAIASDDNVSWYFSEPLDAPKSSVIRLDRRTSYNGGPIGSDIGPLVVGNFNETMRTYGLDRQFRGEIRDLQLFGSHVGSRGALEADEIASQSGQTLQPAANATAPVKVDKQEKAHAAGAPNAPTRRRVIISSDFPPINVVKGGNVPNNQKSDPDDMQSMVRFLLYANEFDIEGLIAGAGTFAMEAHKQHILDVIDRYERVVANLTSHDPAYPTSDYLRCVTYEGLGNNHGLGIQWGSKTQPVTDIIGEGKDSEASNAIIAAADRPDPRPLWIGIWGTPREVSQAIWRVRKDRSQDEFKAFISKLRLFLIAYQDCTHGWLMDEFPDLFIIDSRKTYQGMFGGSDPISNLAWVNENIRHNHGPLCALYPHEGMGCTGVCEGDSPTFMYLVSANRGINNPEDPTQPSWGGQYVRKANTNHYVDGPGGSSISRWRKEFQKEFAERADWCVTPKVHKPRIINTTDLGADPDDEQSMVRFLVCSNEFDTEGLIVATGCWKKSQSNTDMLDRLVNAYGQVYDNLKNHANGYPTPEYLKSISVMGQRQYGMGDVGAGKDSPGSDMIIAAVDKDDPRPVWVGGWGGVNNVAQAIWKVQNTRSAAELRKFISRLRVFDILGQDDAGAWLAKNFPDLFYIRATGVYGWQPEKNGPYQRNIQSHGPLGAVYPDTKWATEGDTPAFMHVYPNGLNDPDQIEQGGWGGRFSLTKKTGIRSMSEVKKIRGDGETRYDPYSMYGNTSDGANAIKRWSAGYNNDFEARMDWTVTPDYAKANHHPVAVVNGDTTRQVLEVAAVPGSSVTLSAAGSSDPDGNSLVYSWSFYQEPSSYTGEVAIQNSASAVASVAIPSDANGKTIHMILELHDNGSPNLYAYRRVIITVQ